MAAMLLVSHPVTASEKILNIVEPFELESPDPATSGSVYIKMGIAETLIDTDAQGNLLPALATDWRVSEDGLELCFMLGRNLMRPQQRAL